MLFFASDLQFRPISIFIVIFFIIGKRILQKHYLTKSVYPSHLIIVHKKLIRKSLQILGLICFSLLPLNLVLLTQKPDIDIILDNSLSMNSESVQPTRLDTAKQFINKLHVSNIDINNCLLLQRETIDLCKNIIILPSSGSSVTDALLLSLQKSGIKLVLSDGGLNQGIELNQIINNSNNNLIYRVDFYPYTGNIIISGTVVASQQHLEKIVGLKNYYKIFDKNDQIQIFKIIKNVAFDQHTFVPFNYILIFVLLIIGTFFSYRHFKSVFVDK